MLVLCMVASCVDNDDDIPENYYQSKKMTAAAFLEANESQFSQLISILKRTPYFSMLSTYGTYSTAGLLKYTLFAPTTSPTPRDTATQGKVGGMLMRNSQRLPTKP